MDAAIAVPGQPGLSQTERVVDTFIAPSKTFTDILRSTSWWLPFVLMVLSSVASAFVVERQVGFERSYENQLHQSPKQMERIDALTPEQKATQMAVGAKFTKGFTYGTPLLLLVFFLIYAVLVWAGTNFGLGAQTTYAQVLAVTFYASLPYLLMTLLTIATLMLGGNAEAYDYKNPVGTNLAYYLVDSSPIVKALLGAFDVVKLWSLALEVLGIAIVARKTVLQAAIVVGGLWLLGLAFQIAGAAFA